MNNNSDKLNDDNENDGKLNNNNSNSNSNNNNNQSDRDNIANDNEHNDNVSYLVNMGFTREQSLAALENCQQNLNAAIETLLHSSHTDKKKNKNKNKKTEYYTKADEHKHAEEQPLLPLLLQSEGAVWISSGGGRLCDLVWKNNYLLFYTHGKVWQIIIFIYISHLYLFY